MDARENLAEEIKSSLGMLADASEANRVPADAALEERAAGMRIFERPLVRFGAAADSLFEEFRNPEAVGPQLLLPGEWLEGAQTVISYFFPMSVQVRSSNRGVGHASIEWFHARIEGQAFVLEAGRHLITLLEGLGYQAVCPASDGRFAVTHIDEADASRSFRSNWSERHAAYACGLGTFSLSRGLITEAGMAGRLGSVITTAPIPPTPRPYSELYEYCIMCGACVDRCPVHAISLETGKDHVPCYEEVTASKKRFPGYYGCGKCQTGVPCEYERP